MRVTCIVPGSVVCAAFVTVLGVPLFGSMAGNFVDPGDNHFDVSGFLDDPYGFLPVVMPITEPAVGFGAAVVPVFIRSNDVPGESRPRRPDIFGAGALATENGTTGLFGFHSGNWLDDRLRTTVALFKASANLDFYGVGGAPGSGRAQLFNIEATGGTANGLGRIADSDWWLGGGYTYSTTTVSFEGGPTFPGTPLEFSTDIGTAALKIRHITLDNFFTPTGGHEWALDLAAAAPVLGADGNWQSLGLRCTHYGSFDERKRWTAGLKVEGQAAFGDTPFFLKPFVKLRGVPAMRFQGDQVVDLEGELRYQFHPRYSVLGFLGAGMTLDEALAGDTVTEEVLAGGAGLRYLVARRYGIHAGFDVGYSEPTGFAFYLQVGNAWGSF